MKWFLIFWGTLIQLVVGQALRVPQASGPAPALVWSQPSSSTAKPSGPQQPKAQASTSSNTAAGARSSFSNLLTSKALEAEAQAGETVILLQKLNQLPSGAKEMCFVCMVHGEPKMYSHGTKGCTYSQVDDEGKLKPTVTQFRSGNGVGKAPGNVGICWNCWLPDLKEGYHKPDQYGQNSHIFQDNIASFAREVYYHQKLRRKLAEHLDDRSVLTPAGFITWMRSKYGDKRGITRAVLLVKWVYEINFM